MAWIYVLKNKINGKMYVGQTINIKERFNDHKNASSRQLIHSAIKKHGWENFEKFIYIVSEDLLDFFEIELIKNLNTLSPNGYNLTTGGNKNKHYAEDVKKRISESEKGEKSAWWGRKHTEETKRKMSEAQNGEKHAMYGKHHTKEAREKMSKSRKGKKFSEEHKLNMKLHNAKPMLGKKASDETKKKLSDSHKGSKNWKAKKVICLDTGEVFDCLKYAAIKYNLNYSSLRSHMQGFTKACSGLHWKYIDDKNEEVA